LLFSLSTWNERRATRLLRDARGRVRPPQELATRRLTAPPAEREWIAANGKFSIPIFRVALLL
jgi:hypothetical protein